MYKKNYNSIIKNGKDFFQSIGFCCFDVVNDRGLSKVGFFKGIGNLIANLDSEKQINN